MARPDLGDAAGEPLQQRPPVLQGTLALGGFREPDVEARKDGVAGDAQPPASIPAASRLGCADGGTTRRLL